MTLPDRTLRVPLRIVFYKEDDLWIAHCLEMDLIGDGTTQDQALELLRQAIICQIDEFEKSRQPENLFFPAETRYQVMFASGQDCKVGAVHIPWLTQDSVIIDELAQRVFVDDDAATDEPLKV